MTPDEIAASADFRGLSQGVMRQLSPGRCRLSCRHADRQRPPARNSADRLDARRFPIQKGIGLMEVIKHHQCGATEVKDRDHGQHDDAIISDRDDAP